MGGRGPIGARRLSEAIGRLGGGDVGRERERPGSPLCYVN